MKCAVKNCTMPPTQIVMYDRDEEFRLCKSHINEEDKHGIQYFKRFAIRIVDLEAQA